MCVCARAFVCGSSNISSVLNIVHVGHDGDLERLDGLGLPRRHANGPPGAALEAVARGRHDSRHRLPSHRPSIDPTRHGQDFNSSWLLPGRGA